MIMEREQVSEKKQLEKKGQTLQQLVRNLGKKGIEAAIVKKPMICLNGK